MGKINGCLKCLFISFNSLFAAIGCMMIYGALKSSAIAQYSMMGTSEIIWFWVFAIGIVGISTLGVCAGRSESAAALKIFAGFMVVGMFVMLGFGIYSSVERKTIKDAFTNAESDASKTYMENYDFKTMLKEIQSSERCCGLSKAEDWGSEIPESCACRGSFECKPRPQDTNGPDQVYAKPCGEDLFNEIDYFMKISLYVMFGFAAIAKLGLLMSMVMVHQVKRHV